MTTQPTQTDTPTPATDHPAPPRQLPRQGSGSPDPLRVTSTDSTSNTTAVETSSAPTKKIKKSNVKKVRLAPSIARSQGLTSAHRQITRIDRLSTLPAELLSQVFSEVDHSRTFRQPISRSLLPYTRKELYRNVVLNDAQSFFLFRQTIAAAPTSIAPLVDSLELSLHDTDREEEDIGPFDPDEDEIENFLVALRNVFHLCILGNVGASVARFILSPKIPKSHLMKHLRTLELYSIFQGWSNPFHSALYTALNRYPTLTKLIIALYSDEGPQIMPLPNFRSSIPQEFTFKYITHLKIEAPFGPEGWTIAQFLGHFASLESLDIENEGRIGYALAFAKLSDTLSHLRIYDHLPSIVNADLLEIILPKRFTLTSLELGYGRIPQTVYEHLARSSSITTLRFSQDCEYNLSDIKQLLAGPLRMKYLEELILDHVQGFSKSPYNGKDIKRHTDIMKSWSPPTWRSTLTYDDAKELATIQDFVEVEITGTLFDAISAQELYMKEKGRLNKKRVEQGMTMI